MTKPRGRPPLPANMQAITINLSTDHIATFFAIGKAGGSPDHGALTAGVRQVAELLRAADWLISTEKQLQNKNTIPTENPQ